VSENPLPRHTDIQDFKTVADVQRACLRLENDIDKHNYRNVVHFGMNTRLKDGTPSIKPAAKMLFGGSELTPELCQRAQDRFKGQTKAMTQDVRKVKNSEISCLALAYCKDTQKQIFFHLNLMDERMITAILHQDTTFTVNRFNPVRESVTAQELYYVYTHWEGENGFNTCTTFLRNFQPVQAPWL
jgi:hypothetical protein